MQASRTSGDPLDTSGTSGIGSPDNRLSKQVTLKPTSLFARAMEKQITPKSSIITDKSVSPRASASN